ncbi:MAG: hypothetical protein M1816_008013 [Peltula sp. TS41687]|nr:MAG: hypothetical protein M1816_008013 [Peltula sp. TS41687]
MPDMEEMKDAMKKRSLRTIHTVGHPRQTADNLAASPSSSELTISQELQYLTDTSVITEEQMRNILSQLEPPNGRRESLAQQVEALQLNAVEPPKNTSNEKKDFYGAAAVPSPYPPPPPPVYGPPPTLAWASAVYAYNPTDAGDVGLLPNDRIAVLEYMNAEWWKGRNERTGHEGIFPRSYVKVIDDRHGFMPHGPPASALPTPNYVNMPMDVSQGGPTVADSRKATKFEEHSKKFGKKLGDATIFGAGATMGSKIVGSIF